MAQPSNQDLIPGFDPTGYPDISGSQLLQLFALSSPYSDKGMIVATDDLLGIPQVPDAVTTTKWQNFIWLRVGAVATVPYVWNPAAASDPTLLQWQSVAQASIGVGTITNAMIADNTIADIKIVSLSYSKIFGAPTNLPPSGAAGGVLTGTYPNPSIGNSQVTTPMIAANAVTHASLGVQAVQPATDIQPSGVALAMIRVNALATAMEFFTPPVIFTSGVVVPTANALKIPQVNTGATDFQMVLPTALGTVLQTLAKTNATPDSTATIIPYDNTIPQITEGKEFINLAITTISASSIIRVRFSCFGGVSNDGNRFILALFRDATANALLANSAEPTDGPGDVVPCSLDYYLASPGAGSVITFRVRFGPSANTAYINQSSTDALFGAAAVSFLSIEELVGTLT